MAALARPASVAVVMVKALSSGCLRQTGHCEMRLATSTSPPVPQAVVSIMNAHMTQSPCALRPCIGREYTIGAAGSRGCDDDASDYERARDALCDRARRR